MSTPIYKVILQDYYVLEGFNIDKGLFYADLVVFSQKISDFYTTDINSALIYICKMFDINFTNLKLNTNGIKSQVHIAYSVIGKDNDIRTYDDYCKLYKIGAVDFYKKTFYAQILLSIDNGFIYNDFNIKHDEFDSNGYFIEKEELKK